MSYTLLKTSPFDEEFPQGFLVHDCAELEECYRGNLVAIVPIAMTKERDVKGYAYAHLLAAAPDLLEALEVCLGYVESDYTGSGGRDLTGGAIDQARRALAKAKGEAK